jgi:hypothetical protein
MADIFSISLRRIPATAMLTLAMDPAKVSSVGFLIADKQDGPFRLEVGSIRTGN